MRRAGAALIQQDGGSAQARDAMARLDEALFGKGGARPEARPIARALLARQTETLG